MLKLNQTDESIQEDEYSSVHDDGGDENETHVEAV